jgi:hypothetical protein
MALLHLEGFEGLATEFETTGLNPNVEACIDYLQSTYHGVFESANNRFHLRRGFDGRGMALACGRDGGGAGLWIGKYFPALATTDEITIGVRVKFPETVKNNAEIIRITGLNSGGTGEARIRTVATNALQINYGTGSSIVATTANNVYNDNGWHYIEWQTVLNGVSSGSYELRVDGVNVASGTGVRTASTNGAQATGVLLWSSAISNDTYPEMRLFDDWYILDQTGTINNDFLGAIKVTDQPVTVIGSDNDFGVFGSETKPNVAIRYNPTVDDTTGITSVNTATNKQLFKCLEYHASNIVGVAVSSRFQIQDGATPVTCKHHVKSGASSNNASERAVLDKIEWTGHHSIYEADPNTSTGWTKTTLDAAEFGVEIG